MYHPARRISARARVSERSVCTTRALIASAARRTSITTTGSPNALSPRANQGNVEPPYQASSPSQRDSTVGSRPPPGAQGGYESRAPFGSPICRYSDAGNIFSGKADCQGRFLHYSDKLGEPKVSDGVAGQCEAERSTFGCYGTVEGGKLATDEGCID